MNRQLHSPSKSATFDRFRGNLMTDRPRRPKRSIIVAALTTVLTLSAGLVAAPAASAAPGPVQTPGAGSAVATALPTAQIDGVVWAQTVAGNTVWAGGQFTKGRPAGAAPGVNTSTRNNLIAYDITTGVMKNFPVNPDIGGSQVKAVAVSPDGSRVYVGGDFTTANGQTRYRIAAYNTSTGALINSFAPYLDYTVNAIAVTNQAVYVGGAFSNAGAPRSELAAFSPVDGALLGWAPTAAVDPSTTNKYSEVHALQVTPDGSKVVIGGSFGRLNGTVYKGIGAVDATTGATVPWATNPTVWSTGDGAAVLSLTTDGTKIYGSAYNYYGDGNVEGVWAMDSSTGAVKWVEDCHGDTYGAFATSGYVYAVSHAHYCGNIGGFPQTDPSWTFHHAMAFTADATGTANADTKGYYSFAGTPSPSIVNWWPDLDIGSYTGKDQAAWSVSGNSSYIVLGGEFPAVNGTPQQGLVRFGIRSQSNRGLPPVDSGYYEKPSLVALGSGAVRVSFPADWDKDDLNLTYRVYKNGGGTPVYTTTADSTFWQRPTLGFVDSTVTAGTAASYRVSISDSSGNTVWGDGAALTPTATPSSNPYAAAVKSDGATTYWPMDEPSGTVAYDNLGFNDADRGVGVTSTSPGVLAGDGAYAFDGTANGSMSTRAAVHGPNSFSTEAWFKTTSTSGGKIIGFGNKQTGTSNNYDRQTYLDNNGKLWFGVCAPTGCPATVTSTGSYNDGAWHHVISTLGAAGLALFVDGKLIGSRNDVTIAYNFDGYWRVGGDSLAGWPGTSSSVDLAGKIDEVAIYPTALSLAQAKSHYTKGGGSVAPTASFTAQTNGLTVAVDGNGSTAPNGSVADYAWSYGDGTSGTGATASHNYVTAGTYPVTLTVTDNKSVTATATKNVTVSVPVNQPPTPSFTVTATGLGVTVDGSASKDSDGTVTGYAWNFGDGGTGTGATASHTYTATGTYPVTLTVTDNSGSTAASTQNISVAPAPPNKPPAAAFTSTADDLSGAFDASTSTDLDGTITNYAWSYGDGSTGTGMTSSRVYAAPGTYTVKLTVTDNDGATAIVSHDITVTAPPPPPNQKPTAAFTSTATDLAVVFDGSGSKDTDGTIASYAWNYGDGTSGTGVKPSHTYTAAGNYSVTLSVTDNAGATDTATSTITVMKPPPANQPPVAAFTSTVSNLSVSLDGSTSKDPDGTIASYAWNYGDGTTGTGVKPSHVYATAGTYQVVLKVTDNKGATNSVTKPVTTAALNVPPTAAFTSTTADLVALFDASTSKDSDGTIGGYAWTFGDGGTGTGVKPSHTFTAAGTYHVTLKVTDNAGASTSITNDVTVSAAPVTVYASDQFARTVAAGLGTADQGGAWTLYNGSSSFAVNGSVGQFKMPSGGSGPQAALNSVSARNITARVDFAMDSVPTGAGIFFTLSVRRIGSSEYRTRALLGPDGSVTLYVNRIGNGVETTLSSARVNGLTFAAGDKLTESFTATGTGSTTTLSAKIWKAAAAEPATSQVTASDSTASLQAAGSVGLWTYLSGSAAKGVTVSIDNLKVQAAS